MPEFFETKMGRQFFDATAPRIAKALERIAYRLESPAPLPLVPTKPPTAEEIDVYLLGDCASLCLDDPSDREHAAARIATWLRTR